MYEHGLGWHLVRGARVKGTAYNHGHSSMARSHGMVIDYARELLLETCVLEEESEHDQG